ncbi:hypothetical protein [Streptomyces chilikensis]|uniref:hypothetical protein n=1 Tax=Streptomyces chilikensis TaxID=1194079 RepID=UPI001F0F9371|nr:hypothetical protein [Streptomyces chilikensis]
MHGTAVARRAVEWPASVVPDPAACRREWARRADGVVLLPAGKGWDVLTLPGGPGRATPAVLRCPGRPGPVPVGFDGERVGFLVPPGTAGRWLGTGVRAAGRGTWVVGPDPGRVRGARTRRLVPPGGTGLLTDPVRLEIAVHEAVAGPTGGRALPGRSRSAARPPSGRRRERPDGP